MKPIVILLISILSTVAVQAQSNIKLDEVSKHIGDSVTVCGKVSDVRFFENSNRQPTFLNIGDKYPNQQLTLVVWGETRKLFTDKPEDMKGKDICITGRIILYKEKPEIVIEKPAQIVIQ
jgi:DNA/RNA endonuclease YhcR with UshA esterase domain